MSDTLLIQASLAVDAVQTMFKLEDLKVKLDLTYTTAYASSINTDTDIYILERRSLAFLGSISYCPQTTFGPIVLNVARAWDGAFT